MNRDTICVQGGYTPGNGEPRQIPIIQSTTFKYATSEDMGKLFDLEADGYFYSRLQNPTCDMVAKKICELEGGTAAMLTSSGQAANFFALFNICEAGDHIVASSTIYGGTFNLISVTMKKMGITATFVDPLCSEEELDAVNAAALSNKLLQMANGAVYGEDKKVISIHDRKLDALEDLVEAANGKPVLVAYWYKHDLMRIQKRLPEARVIDTSKDITDWNHGEIAIGLIHPASAGHGLNLQEGGCTIVWFGLTWSLELYQQMNARLWRQGQKHTVVIHHLITKGTHDEDVMKALEKKETGQSALIHAVRARIGGM